MRPLLLLLLSSFALGNGVHAQLYNHGTLFIANSSSGILSLDSFTNNAGATFQNNGTLNITGVLINDQSAMGAGAGTDVTRFAGSAAQTLSGTQPYRNVNIVIDNPAGLTLRNRLAIGDGTGGLLSFVAGTITSGNNTQDVYFYPGSTYVGFDSSHHVIGYVTKSGNTDFDFPIGTGIHPADLGLTGLTGIADFQVQYVNGGFGQYNTDGTLVGGGVYGHEYWNLAMTAGFGDAQVTLKWDDARNPLNHSNPAGLVVAHFTNGSWTDAGGTSANPASSAVGAVGPSNALSSFSPFTFGSTATPLPIILSSFTVTNEDCKAYLTWTTSIEQNSDHFDIQQSADAVNYATVATVRADDAPNTYHATVTQTSPQAFYRLRLVSLDGSSVYSPIDELSLSCLAGPDHLALYPNPLRAGGIAQVNFSSSDAHGTASLQVFDAQGRRVYSSIVTVKGGLNQYNLPAAGLAQGIYSVIIIGNEWKSDVILLNRD